MKCTTVGMHIQLLTIVHVILQCLRQLPRFMTTTGEYDGYCVLKPSFMFITGLVRWLPNVMASVY